MKKLLLSALAVSALAINANAQAIAKVLQPASFAGLKTFTWADSWGQTPDFNSPGVFEQGFLAFGEDGTTGNSTTTIVHPLSQEGCNPFVNAAAVQGKIAVVFRGTCEFGAKALNAQNAGAIACIVINRDPEAIAMGGGAQGGNVTIPCVMLTSTDGVDITTAIQNATPVEMFLGNKVGVNTDDISTNAGVARIPNFGGAASTYQNIGFTPAIEIYNYGTADQPTVSVNATITGPSGSVYDETVTLSMLSGDTVYIQTGNPQSFAPFSLSSYPDGDYNLTYTITLGSNTDEDPSDNVISSDFRVTQTIISGSRLDANNKVVASTYPSNSAGTYFGCMSLRLPANHPSGHGIIAFDFVPEADTAAVTLVGSEILLKVFEWSDSSVLDNSSLAEIASVAYYPASDAETRQVQHKHLGTSEQIALAGNQLYLVCLNTSDGVNIAFGYDSGLDYSGNNAITGLPTSPVNVDDTWYGGGWTGTSALSLGLNMDELSGINETEKISAQVFPNPASDLVKVRLNATGKVNIVVTDITGKVVANTTNTLVGGLTTLNTESFEAGMYVFSMTTENGQTTTVNVVKK